MLLTVGYKFVNDLENWFSLPWLWRHRTICVTGGKSPIYTNSMPGSKQLCMRNFARDACSIHRHLIINRVLIDPVCLPLFTGFETFPTATNKPNQLAPKQWHCVQVVQMNNLFVLDVIFCAFGLAKSML